MIFNTSKYLGVCVVLVLMSGCSLTRGQQHGKWESPFNGKDLTGWVKRGGDATYTIENGVIVGTTKPGPQNTFLCTTKHYDNFILEVEFKGDSLLNSGIQIRSNSTPDYLDGRVHGYQVEIDPSKRSYSGAIYDEARRGIFLADLKDNEAARKAIKRTDWNKFRIEANGPVMKTWINGVPAVELNDNMTASGFIALQVHATKYPKPLQIRWRNIRIQQLTAVPVAKK